MCTGFSASLGKIEKQVGLDDARKLFAIAEEGKALIRERVQRYGIDCNLKWGYLHAAPKPRHLDELREELDEAQERFGYDKLRLVDRDEVRRMVDSPIYVGGLYDGGAGIFTRSTIAWVWLRPRTTLAYVSSRIHKLSDCSSASRPSL